MSWLPEGAAKELKKPTLSKCLNMFLLFSLLFKKKDF